VPLPALESRARAAAEPPRRFLAFFVPNGIVMDSWTPRGEGAKWQLSPTLQPLAPHRAKVSVLSGLDNLPAREPEGKGDHACGTAGFLTCRQAHRLPDGAYRLGISMDQVAAEVLGRQTRLPSLQLGVKSDSPVCDPGYSCAYINNISWASETQPLPKITRPDFAFDLLFGGTSPTETAAARQARRLARTSVLDYVLAQSRRLSTTVGAADRRKLDEYFTSLREVEQRAANLAPLRCTAPERPRNDSEIPARIRAMLDLIVLAFRCDATRVISFMMGNGFEGGLNFPFLGISANHHPLSHHQNRPENLEALRKIDAWEIQQLAYLLARLDEIPEGEGTLLDATAVYFSSELEDGNGHKHTNLPVVLAGRAGGRLRTGVHLRYDRQPLANLYVSLLQALGVEVNRFGADGTGPLQGLTTG
jgi:hypothetical protein